MSRNAAASVLRRALLYGMPSKEILPTEAPIRAANFRASTIFLAQIP